MLRLLMSMTSMNWLKIGNSMARTQTTQPTSRQARKGIFASMLSKDETGWLLPIVDLGAMRLCMHHNSVLPYGSMVPTPCALRPL